MNDSIVLSFKNVYKYFPGVCALKDVSFEVERGTVHAIVGENGAGKSTLIKILAGVFQMSSGDVYFNGEKTNFKTPDQSLGSGISVVHQEMKLVDSLTITENIFLGNLKYKYGLVDWKYMKGKAIEMLDGIGLQISPDICVGELTVARKQMVEICKAINHDCKLIVMDEPSATLTEKELNMLFDIIEGLKNNGWTIVYISHRLEEVFSIADNVTVLRDGEHVGTVPVCSVDRTALISMMVGRELEKEFPKQENEIGEKVLEVVNICRKGVLKDINFHVRKGEVLGIAGLVGAGRTELVRAILGIDKIDSGEVIFKGKKVIIKNFKQAIDKGLGLVPEDRKLHGLILPFSVKENVCLVNMSKIIRGGIVKGKLEKEHAQEYVKKLRIVTPSVDFEVGSLSGGNQQKVVISKWLLQDSDVFFLDEPTRGVDVGAKVEIYKIINSLVEKGKTVVMISSELPEILGMCDRIIVMQEGKLVGELTREEATQEKIIALCV